MRVLTTEGGEEMKINVVKKDEQESMLERRRPNEGKRTLDCYERGQGSLVMKRGSLKTRMRMKKESPAEKSLAVSGRRARLEDDLKKAVISNHSIKNFLDPKLPSKGLTTTTQHLIVMWLQLSIHQQQ